MVTAPTKSHYRKDLVQRPICYFLYNTLFSLPFPAQFVRDKSEEFISQQINVRDVAMDSECQYLQQSQADGGSTLWRSRCWMINLQINLCLWNGSLGAPRHRLQRKHVKAAESSLISCSVRQPVKAYNPFVSSSSNNVQTSQRFEVKRSEITALGRGIFSATSYRDLKIQHSHIITYYVDRQIKSQCS